MGNLKVKADIRKNMLVFHFSGIATQKAMERLYTDVRFCAADLTPGFDVISDFSECTLIHLNSIPALKKIMSYLLEKGLREIVRVLQRDKTAHRQILNLATRVQGYKPIYVANLAEAEEKLQNAAKRKGLRVHLHRLPISYIQDDQEKQGYILNISTSGCAIEFTASYPQPGCEIQINAAFTPDPNPPEYFTIKAKVIRVIDNAFAAEFTELDHEKKEQLWQCLLRESRS